jgi:5'-nucleotidase
MKILITNDDGVHAEGLWTLYRCLESHHEVTVVAPDRECSAIGHAISLHRPLRSVTVTVNGGQSAVAVNGTPADCVKFALLEVVPSPPDLVISGINPGANVGININYSGTVAAAKEAALYGVPAVAVSLEGPACRHMESAGRFARCIAERIQRYGLPRGTLLNVNLPDLPLERVAGVKVSRHGCGRLADRFEKRTDPRQRHYFWQGADSQRFDDQPEADGAVLAAGCISITPLRCDMTDEGFYEQLHRWDLSFE